MFINAKQTDHVIYMHINKELVNSERVLTNRKCDPLNFCLVAINLCASYDC